MRERVVESGRRSCGERFEIGRERRAMDRDTVRNMTVLGVRRGRDRIWFLENHIRLPTVSSSTGGENW